MSEDVRTVELTGEMRIAYELYAETTRAELETAERKKKARDVLLVHMALLDADKATVDGEEVLSRSTYTRESVDTARLKVEEPLIYRRFARLTAVEALRMIGKRS
jgi:predicted phage-related endonuclease